MSTLSTRSQSRFHKSTTMTTISKCINVVILTSLFLYYIINSYLTKLSEPTTFEEVEKTHCATFPSLTVCPRNWGQDDFKTFDDVLVAIDAFKAKTQAWLGQEGIGVPQVLKDLKNESMLFEDFNTSLDYVWESSAIMQPQAFNPIIPCLTINVPPNLKSPEQGINYIRVKINDNQDNLYLTKHGYHQSQENYHIDQSVSFEILKPDLGHIEYLIQTETSLLNKVRHDCLEDNSMYLKVCLDDFIADQLSCSLPWTSRQVSGSRQCQSEVDLQAFRNLSFHMTSKKIKDLIAKKGCFKPNCKTSTWTKNQYIETWPLDGYTEFYIMITPDSKVLQRKEVLLADFGTFLADIGSYLGFFLGASILSLTELGLSYIKKTCKTIFDKICSRSLWNTEKTQLNSFQ